MSYSVAELMCVAMSREVADGDVVLEGIGTFLPSAAYELALASHAPGLTIFSPTTGGYRRRAAPLSLAGYERALDQAAGGKVDYIEMVLWHLPAYLVRRPERFKEFLRPAQVDPRGNTNNVSVTRPDGRSIRLPGAVGVPDTMGLHERVLLYLPRHESRVFVPNVEVLSGVGSDGSRPVRLVTDLGVFGFGASGMEAISVHPGVTLDQVRERTGIPVGAPARIELTEPPTAEQLALIREAVDPEGLRELEFLGSRDRMRVLAEQIRVTGR